MISSQRIRDQGLYAAVGKNIAGARHRLGLTQSELAETAGLSRGSIANMETGRQLAPLHTLYDISEALGRPIGRLLPKQEDSAWAR